MDKRILVIEDDPTALRFIRNALQQEGYQVLTATNGLAGLRKAKREEPDLIVLDIMLPGIDGFEICHRLRAEPQTAPLPILMISAWAQEIAKATGLKVGADDYLLKPADPSEIVSRMRKLLAQKTTTKSKIITFLGSREGVGTTSIVIDVAIALSQEGKRVIVVDLCPNQGNISEQLGLKPGHTIAELLAKPLDTIDRGNLESALAVHQTGVRVLAIPQPSEKGEDISPIDFDPLLERLQEVTDYLLVDLPFKLPSAVGVVLAKCNFVIIVTDSKAGDLPSVKSTVTLLGRLGIAQERIGTVVIDREGLFPEEGLPSVKPIIELDTGVSLLGIIPYDTKASLKLTPSNPSVILSNPNCPMACSIRGVAQHISGKK
jgi:CheY-like chemotaxis protein/MinD-like ATPase involved in chromosome partitioning or flagellar assembly